MIRITAIALALSSTTLLARDDGRYAQSQNKQWFEQLQSKQGANCCSDADGQRLDDPKWEQNDTGYRVFLNGGWIDVPDAAIVTATNRVGYAMVWPAKDNEGGIAYIRCFMPGSRS